MKKKSTPYVVRRPVPTISLEPPFTVKIMKGKAIVGTLLISEEGVEFLPKCYKKAEGRVLKWQVLTALSKTGVF